MTCQLGYTQSGRNLTNTVVKGGGLVKTDKTGPGSPGAKTNDAVLTWSFRKKCLQLTDSPEKLQKSFKILTHGTGGVLKKILLFVVVAPSVRDPWAE